MTARELIERLNKFPPDTIVVIEDHETLRAGFYPLLEVELEPVLIERPTRTDSRYWRVDKPSDKTILAVCLSS